MPKKAAKQSIPSGGSRDPVATRRQIIEAATKLLGGIGKDSFSLSEVARAAGVNRGTAYFHFKNREQLLSATIQNVSEEITTKFYANLTTAGGTRQFDARRFDLIEEMALFFIDNPELGRIWLTEILAKEDVFSDPLWLSVRNGILSFSASPSGRPDSDPEVMTLIVLAGYFLWPLVIKSHRLPTQEKRKMARRLTNEIIRYSLYGSIKPETVPELVATHTERSGRRAVK